MKLLHIWDAVEADFQRDYHIDLVEQLDHMSWRKFMALVNNLSPYGAVAACIRAKNEDNGNNNPKNDEDAANALFSSIVAV